MRIIYALFISLFSEDLINHSNMKVVRKSESEPNTPSLLISLEKKMI